jgi:hypothetical protein
MTEQRKGTEVAKQVSAMINGYGSNEQKQFIEEMSRDHRTLQQGFTRLCVAWFENLAERESHDLRNQGSVELAKELKPILDKAYLPFI